MVAELCAQYLVKGRKCAVVGSLQTRSYEDKEGVKRYVTEVVADEVEFLGSNSQQRSEDAQSESPLTHEKADEEQDDDDELPF